MKRILSLALAAILVFPLSACNSAGKPAGTGTTNTPTTTVAATAPSTGDTTADSTESTSAPDADTTTEPQATTSAKPTSATTSKKATSTTAKVSSTSTAKPTSKTTTGKKATSTTEKKTKNKLQIFKYNAYDSFVDGIALVKNDSEKVGMIDALGNLLVDYKYSSGIACNGGYAVFEKRYVYDKTGKLVFEDKNSTIEHCSYGVVLLTEYGKWDAENHTEEERMDGYTPWSSRKVYKKIDGTVLYSFFMNDTYDRAGQFNEQGFAWLVRQDCTCCFDPTIEIINLKGEVVKSLNSIYNYEVVASSRMTMGKENYLLLQGVEEAGLHWNRNLETLIFYPFETSWNGKSFYELSHTADFHSLGFSLWAKRNDCGHFLMSINSLAVMSVEDEPYYLFDIDKSKIVAEYPYISLSESKFILVKNSKDQWGYIDKTGKEYTFYEDATTFHNGYTMVKIDKMLYVIDETFTIVSEGIEGDSVSSCGNNWYSVEKGNDTFMVKFTP